MSTSLYDELFLRTILPLLAGVATLVVCVLLVERRVKVASTRRTLWQAVALGAVAWTLVEISGVGSGMRAVMWTVTATETDSGIDAERPRARTRRSRCKGSKSRWLRVS
jgi:hypothetical protein